MNKKYSYNEILPTIIKDVNINKVKLEMKQQPLFDLIYVKF